MARNKVFRDNKFKRRSIVRSFLSNFSLKKSSLRRNLIPSIEKDFAQGSKCINTAIEKECSEGGKCIKTEDELTEDLQTTRICYPKQHSSSEEHDKIQNVNLESSKEEPCVCPQRNHNKEYESVSQSETKVCDANEPRSSFSGGFLRVGSYVKVCNGTYVNQFGTVTRLTKKQALISLNESEKVLRLNQDKLQVLESINCHERKCIPNEDSRQQMNECSDFHNGSKVFVIDGKYRGRKGVILGLTNMKAHIELEKESNKESIRTCLFQKSLKMDNSPNFSSGATTIEKDKVNSPRSHNENMSVGDTVFIHRGKFASQSGTLIKKCNKTFKISISGVDRIIKHDFVRTEVRPIISDDFRIPDSHSNLGSLHFGKLVIRKFDASYEPENCFLRHYLGNRSRIVEIRTGGGTFDKNQIPVLFEEKDGNSYELLCHKLVHHSEGRQIYQKSNILRLTYLLTKGINLAPVSPVDIFDKLGDFGSLSLRKQVARIQLLSSPAYKFSNGEYFKIYEASCFSEIPDKGHVGCGFICEKFLTEILGPTRAATQATSVQVRLVIPSMGIYKGMLMRKKMDTNGPRVLLPSSMKKVPASKHPDRSMNAYLSICQAGVDPSQTSLDIGSIINGGKSSKSFRPKCLGDMISRLLLAWGVPKDVLDTNSATLNNLDKSSRKNMIISHAYVRGVADPTGEIPAESCFLTGFNNDSNSLLKTDFVFITRSPCIRASDGKKINVMTTKPPSMSDESYSFLTSLPFGLIIFGFPTDKMKATPELIAEGDLDGDRFFVCWDANILTYLKADFVIQQTASSVKHDIWDDRSDENRENSDQNWFQKIQNHFVNEDSYQIEKLIAKLYSLSENEALADTKNGIRNKNAEAFAEAYVQALENGKHGTKIELPHELHKMVPPRLRKYLVTSEKNNGIFI